MVCTVVIMPLFALGNADVVVSFAGAPDPITMAVFAGFVFGKPLGIVLFTESRIIVGNLI